MDDRIITKGPLAPTVTTETTVAPPPNLDAAFLPTITVKTDTVPGAEYLSSGGWPWLPGMLRSLPRYIDDITRDLGADLYWKMVEGEPVLQSGIRLLVAGALAPGLQILPAYADKVISAKSKEYDTAAKCAEHIELQFARLGRTYHTLLTEMGYEALATGHSLAEQIFEDRLIEVSPGQGPQWALRDIKPKPPESYALVVTPTNEFLGVQYALPGQPVVTPTMVLPLPDGTIPRFLPRRFLFHLAWHTKWDDPRGLSQMQAAYMGWWLKHQLIPDYRQWLAVWANPPILGHVPRDAAPVKQKDNSIKTAEQAFLDVLNKLRNGAAVVAQEGNDAQPITQQGTTAEGGPFTAAFGWCDRQMTQAVMYQIRTTIEAQFGSKADSGTAENLLDLLVSGLQLWLTEGPRRDIVRPILAANYGAAVASAYAPILSLATTTPANFPAEAHAAAELKSSGYLSDEMLPAMDGRLGLGSIRVSVPTPPPPPEPEPNTGEVPPTPNPEPSAQENTE